MLLRKQGSQWQERVSIISTPHCPCCSQPHVAPPNFPEIQPNIARQKIIYRGLQPTIPDFTCRDPGAFACLKLALNNLLPGEATELFKYQVLVGHLKLIDARLIADSFLNSSTPYSLHIYPLQIHPQPLVNSSGRPHELALTKIAAIMDASNVQTGDTVGF